MYSGWALNLFKTSLVNRSSFFSIPYFKYNFRSREVFSARQHLNGELEIFERLQ